MTCSPTFARWAALPAALAAFAMAHAGQLTPPASPVEETGRFGPRTEVNAANTPGDADSIFKITEPGSYYLADNITGESGKHGIEIAASDVTLDLGGFQLTGVPGALDGIFYNGAGQGLKVLNGSIRSWPGDGLDGNVAASATIRDVVSVSNGGWGMRLSSGGIVESCIARNNVSGGIRVTTATVVRNCVSIFNGGTGIEAFSGSTITGNSATSNGASGIITDAATTIANNTAHSNIGDGIRAGAGSIVTGNTTTSNTLDGIFALDGCHVIGNISRLNQDDGIQVAGGCYVHENHCDEHPFPGAGIHVTGQFNRIDSNLVSNASLGISLVGTKNLVTRNTITDFITAIENPGGVANKVGDITATPLGAGAWDNITISSLN